VEKSHGGIREKSGTTLSLEEWLGELEKDFDQYAKNRKTK